MSMFCKKNLFYILDSLCSTYIVLNEFSLFLKMNMNFKGPTKIKAE